MDFNKIKIKAYIFIVLAAALFVASAVPQVWAESAQSREYQIKAAFLYNFIKFVDWPEKKVADSNDTITIGIIGEDPFGDALKPIKDKQIKGKKIVTKQFKGFEELKKSKTELRQKNEILGKCHLLFICSSEKENLREIINSVKDSSVLTVGNMKGFLEAGGVINFIMEQKKVHFEISVTAAEQAEFKIRSKLLRLAKEVVNEKTTSANNKEKPSQEAKN